MLYPLTFHPILKERVWGGRNLERLYRKQLPPEVPVGESWEISDRPGDASVIANGPLAGKDLRWLMQHHGQELLGPAYRPGSSFPLLVKILDAQEKLSLQVHPPGPKAAALKGEPKTEMWYIADAAPGAELYVGLKRGVTPAQFEKKIADDTVADCFHRVPVKSGDTMFLPSGRVHALGSGLVIFEIQQNSDTTYRVFDWNRVGLDGKPRELHIPQSLASIDFNDFEPGLVRPESRHTGDFKVDILVHDPLFTVECWESGSPAQTVFKTGDLQILCALTGTATVKTDSSFLALSAGQFCLLPASLPSTTIEFCAASRILVATPGPQT